MANTHTHTHTHTFSLSLNGCIPVKPLVSIRQVSTRLLHS